MLKRFVAVLLAVCLCFTALSVQAVAEEWEARVRTPSEKLEDFLLKYNYFGTIEFDKNTSTQPYYSGYYNRTNFLESVLTQSRCGFLEDMIYPGEPATRTGNGSIESTIPDPLRLFPFQGQWHSFIKLSESRVDWVMENIMNVLKNDVSVMKRAVSPGKNSSCYLHQGYYYITCGGIGGPGKVVHLMEKLQRGNLQYVTYYTTYDRGQEVAAYGYAIVEPKVIDGTSYWTMHYNKQINAGQNPLASGGFVDVPAGSYYTEPVKWAVENGITSGIGTATFGPDQSCTRAQAVTFLWNAAGKPEPQSGYSPFTDVAPTDWYYKAVLWAVENDVTSGIGNGRFNPSGTCSRGQIVTFLWRSKGQPFAGNTSSFVDVSKGAYYENAVSWAVENGITTGVGDGRFNPDGTCTRGQIVTFLHRNR